MHAIQYEVAMHFCYNDIFGKCVWTLQLRLRSRPFGDTSLELFDCMRLDFSPRSAV